MNNSKMTIIYLIRHGQSEANVVQDAGGKHMGKDSEVRLTNTGIQQAKKRAQELKDIHFDHIFSSDFLRAQHTAEIIALEHKLIVEVKEAIGERNYGKTFSDLPREEQDKLDENIKKDLEELDDKGRLDYKPEGYTDLESAGEAMMRLFTFLREVAVVYEGKTVAVVNHGDILRSLLTHLGWATYDELPHGTMLNTAYVVLESDGVDFFIKRTVDVEKKQGMKRGL